MKKELNKKLPTILLALFMLTAISRGQVVGSKHDLSTSGSGSYKSGTQVCAFCHTPHQAPNANKQYPLWNHTLSTHATYGVYSSPTMDSTPEEIGLATPGSATVSHLCLGCHDGSIALGNLYNQPNAGGPADTSTKITGDGNLGTDLTDDHPVHLEWDHQTEVSNLCTNCHNFFGPNLYDLPFFNGYIECATCHDVHNGTGHSAMARASLTGSSLCLGCHEK